MESRTFTASDGFRVPYVSIGAAHHPAVLLLHGWTSRHNDWRTLPGALAQAGYQVAAWDARGHGDAMHAPLASVHLDRMADDLAEWIDTFGRPVVAVGHSMGALTIWHCMQRHGMQRFAALCCIDQSPRLRTAPDWPHGIYGNFSAEADAAHVASMRHNFAEAVLQLSSNGLNAFLRQRYQQHPERFDRVRRLLGDLPVEAMIQAWCSLSPLDFRQVVQAIPCPVLLVHGGQSQFYTPEAARWLQQHIPQASLRLYPDADHTPHWLEGDRFVRDLVGFLLANQAAGTVTHPTLR